MRMDKIPLLIVDDNLSHLKLEKIVLGDVDYDIRTATDAAEAMKVLTEFKPKLILMDIKLPDIDGLELTRRLKADPKYKDIIILAITAYGMSGDEEMALSAGCDGYFSKPIDTETFPQAIAEYLGKSKVSATPQQ